VFYLALDDLLAIASEVLELEVDALLRVTDLGLADSAVSRRQATFAGQEFHTSIEAKAATLHLDLTPPEEAYKTITGDAAGKVTLDALTTWVPERPEQMRDE
jgi:hypothetical protein